LLQESNRKRRFIDRSWRKFIKFFCL